MASEGVFFAALNAFGERLTNLDDILLAVGGEIVQELKLRAPVDEGELRNSIGAVVQNNSLSIEMLVYGLFQNYGVAGTDGDSRFGVVNPVPAGILPPPRQSDKYQFRERRYGIPAQSFFNYEELAQRIQTEITNRLEY